MKSILVVDDDFSVRKAVSFILQGAGYSVKEVEDRYQTMNAIRTQRFDLLIIDLFLRGEDGLALAQELAAESPDQKFIVITAHSDHARAKRAKAIYGENFLDKSTLQRDLLIKVKALLS